MAYKNTAITICIFAWDTANSVGKTGDSANITIRAVGDGTEFTPAAPAVTEIDSTNMKGVYSVALAAGENNYTSVMVGGKSSTSGIVINPVQWQNDVATIFKKNTALPNFTFPMTDSTNHVPTSGLTCTATRSLDGAAYGAGTLSAVSEIGTTGRYKFNFAAGDLNAAEVAVRVVATGADDMDFTIITTP